jgi:hypothetical protein
MQRFSSRKKLSFLTAFETDTRIFFGVDNIKNLKIIIQKAMKFLSGFPTTPSTSAATQFQPKANDVAA